MKLTPIVSSPLMRQAIAVRAAASPPETSPVSGEQVSLSAQGLAKAAGKNETVALHDRIYGTPGLGNQIGNEYRSLGEEKFLQTQPPENYGPDQVERFNKTLSYLVSLKKLRDVETKYDENPFWGMTRDALAEIEIDEENYTKEERYAAHRAKGQLTDLYFVKLIDHVNNTGDERPLLKGYLEFLDNITPVERLEYPSDERDKIAARLARAENESGSLPKDFSLWQYINWDPKGRLNLESMLDPSITEPAAPGAAGSADDQGNSRLR